MTADQTKSLSLAVGIHILIALLMMYIFITTPNPPWEEGLAGGGGGGSFVEFGTVDFAEVTPAPAVQQEQKQAVTKENEEELMTSEAEVTVDVNKTEKRPVKNPVKPVETKKPVIKKTTAAPVVALPKVEERKVNQAALYKPGSKGNPGAETGTKEGNGTGGDGTGNGGGNGSGTGPGSGGGSGTGHGGGNGDGVGIYYDLTGRNWLAKPSISDNSQEQGKVVIDIVVDKYGKVLSANGPGRGSTTTSSNLVRKAKEAALKAKFSASDKGVEEQKGSITFNFILR